MMARLLRTLALAGLEATALSLPLLVLTSIALPWGLLVAVVLLGALADALILRLPPRLDRPALLASALVAVLLLVGAGLGLGPLGALAALLPGAPRFGQAYFLLLLALYLFWRGTRVASRDSSAIGTVFGRGTAALLVALLLRPVVRPSAELPPDALFAQVTAFVSLGLLALSLSHAGEEGGERRLSWRWLLTLALAIGGVVLFGGLLATLLGGGAALQAAATLVQLILLPFALIGAALAWLFFTLFAGPLAWVAQVIRGLFERLPEPAEQPEQQAADFYSQDPGEFITTVATSATWLMALIPVVILVVAILLLRRRRRPPPRDEEERESLGLAASLAGDLRDLLGRLRNPFARHAGGLRAVLAALAGQDPSSRVRRAYLRMLIGLEPQLPRPPAQTPAEYAPAAGAAAAAPEQVAVITRAYERARYDPAGADQPAAEAAESALAALNRPRQPQR